MAALIYTMRAAFQRLRASILLDGRLRVAQPWALLLGPAVLAVALLAPYRWLFYIGYAYLLLMLVAYGWVRLLGPRVALQRRQGSEWAQVGDALDEQWQLANHAPIPLLWLEVEDQSTLPGYHGRRVAAAPAGGEYRWLTQAICTRRGVYTLGPLVARLGDPFGLFRYEWQDAATRQIVIYPPLVRLPPLVLPQGQRGGLARADVQQQHATPSVGGLRPYTPGDMLSHVHWPTFARTDELMVKEFDQERAGALWIALDLDAAAYAANAAADAAAPVAVDVYEWRTQSSLVENARGLNTAASPLELAITLACSLAAQALADGRSVGLLADDGRRRVLTPGRGPRQLWRVLSELVDAQGSGATPLGDLLRQGQSAHGHEIAGAGVVVITPALDGAWVPALAAWLRGRPGGALALLVAPQAQDAQPLATRLAAGGIRAETFAADMALPLLNPPRVDATARVSPLGRVVSN